MATKYPFEEFTRVVIAPSVADLDAPTTSEINAGEDITCDLTADGLKLGAGNNSIGTGALCSDIDSQVAGKRTFSASLMGFKFLDPDDEILWPLAVFKSNHFLIVRYGVPHDQAWANTDPVHVYDFQFGKRSVVDSGSDTLVTFTVPLHIADEEDDAFVGGVS